MIKNIQGLSLVSVMVAGSIAGAIMMYVADYSLEFQKTTTYVQQSRDQNYVLNGILRVLQNPAACELTFPNADSIVNGYGTASIRNANGDFPYRISDGNPATDIDEYGFTGINIISMILSDVIYPGAGCSPNCITTANLNVTFQKSFNNDNVSVVKQIPLRFFVQEADPDTPDSCFSGATSSSSSFWYEIVAGVDHIAYNGAVSFQTGITSLLDPGAHPTVQGVNTNDLHTYRTGTAVERNDRTTIGNDSSIFGGRNQRISVAGNNSIIGAGNLNEIKSRHAAITGGDSNSIDNGSYRSIIFNGRSNRLDSNALHSVIGSGYESNIFAESSFIGSHVRSTSSQDILDTVQNGFIGTGTENQIGQTYSFIGTGVQNTTNANTSSTYADIHASVIFSGNSNETVGSGQWIGTGQDNSILSHHPSYIVTGVSNSVNPFARDFNAIIGGTNNQISVLNPVRQSVIFNGVNQAIDTYYNWIGTGQNNAVGDLGNYSWIGTGTGSFVLDEYSYIMTGSNNVLDSGYSVIGSGDINIQTGGEDYVFIGTGYDNYVEGGPYVTVLNGFGTHSRAANGENLSVILSGSGIAAWDMQLWDSYASVLGTGEGNRLHSSHSSAILNGQRNYMIGDEFNFIGTGVDIRITSGSYNAILSGDSNEINSDMGPIKTFYDLIVTGENNEILNSDYSVISGGMNNMIDGSGPVRGDYAVIVGNDNHVEAPHAGAVGRHLIADSYGELIIGSYNENLAYGSKSGYVGTNPVVVFANGGHVGNRKNAMIVFQAGSTMTCPGGTCPTVQSYDIAMTDGFKCSGGCAEASISDLYVVGNTQVDGTYTISSDRTKKTEIEMLRIDFVRPLIKDLEAYSYKYNFSESKKDRIGFLAEDVERYAPELIRYTDDGNGNKQDFRTVNYYGFVAPVIEGIKDTSKQADEIKNEVEHLLGQL